MSIQDLAAAIRSVESNGNYKAQGIETKYGRATGAYQFLDSTWGGYGGYHSAADAPPQVQDAKALAAMTGMYQELQKRAPGLSDTQYYRLIAIAWHAGFGTALKALKTGTAGTSDGLITSDAYAERVLHRLGMSGTLAPGTGAPLPPSQAATPPASPPDYKADLVGQLMNIFGPNGGLSPLGAQQPNQSDQSNPTDQGELAPQQLGDAEAMA